MPQINSPRLIVISNAGPVKYRRDGNGHIVSERSGGGLVTAISGLNRAFTWVQAPATEIEFEMAAGRIDQPPFENPDIEIVLARMTPEQREALYALITNGALVHCALYQPDLASPMLAQLRPVWDETWELFQQASMAMARAALDEILSTPRGTRFGVFIEDYQMVLVPELLRRLLVTHGREADVAIQDFTHTTWAGPEYWEVLPASAPSEIVRGMLGADTLMFHSPRDVRNFAACAQQWLSREARVNRDQIEYEGRRISLVANPIGIDTGEFQGRLASEGGQAAIAAIQKKIAGRRHVFGGIGRVDPTKKLDVLVEAFARWLDANPDKTDDAVLLLHLTKSRSGVPVYDRYKENLDNQIDEVNERFQTQAGGKNVIEAYYASDPYLPVGLDALYNVLVTPSLADGFALTAVEGPLLNKQDGVVVLSTGTGAYDLLKDGVLRFEPGGAREGEVEQLTRLLDEAMLMPLAERRRRQAFLRALIHEHDLAAWLRVRLSHILDVLEQKARRQS